ncbi:phage holin family protein [Amycolatopsis samaneae]|uniref:Phage holin family protein n=1 Tax=Amycolatopsis samaneae TaxID=664691 RepID=A0ABW5GJN4_9PSEU
MTTVSSPKHERTGPDGVGAVPYLPLSNADEVDGEQSIGKLVGDATQHLSTLVRAEVELAKSEIAREAKKGLKGAVFFLVALTVALYSSFFFFFFLGELLSEWLKRWAAYGIVFLLMLAAAGVAGFLGYRKVKQIKGPERTITSVKDTAAAFKPSQEPETADDLPTAPRP